MNITEALKNLGDVLDSAMNQAEPTQQMTVGQFLVYAEDQVAKAAKEPKDKAKKRLAHLRANVATLAKADMWESAGGPVIPLYEEPNLTGKAEESEKESPLLAVPASGTGSFVENPGDIGKALEKLNEVVSSFATSEEVAAPAAPVASADQTFTEAFWPTDVNTPSFMKEGVTKSIGTELWGKDNQPVP